MSELVERSIGLAARFGHIRRDFAAHLHQDERISIDICVACDGLRLIGRKALRPGACGRGWQECGCSGSQFDSLSAPGEVSLQKEVEGTVGVVAGN